MKKIFVNKSSEKWTQYFLQKDEIDFIKGLRTDKRVSTFGSYFNVDVGVVTGKNDYFIIDKFTAEMFDLHNYIIPAVGRSHQLQDEVFTASDWRILWENGKNVGLLNFPKINNDIPSLVTEYLAQGIMKNVHSGYKCANRKEWYIVPSIWVPDAFMFRQIHDFPHLVINEARAVSTDTIHRVKKQSDEPYPQVLFYTFLTAASAEIEGRSYGGGVLELEPTEAEKLLVPNPQLIDHKKLYHSVIRKENGKFLEKNSYYTLGELMNFSPVEVKLLENIYKKMFNRRKNRKRINHGEAIPYTDQSKYSQ
jgi:adenine-specific DNA methylase